MGSGCASHRPPPTAAQITQKRHEVQALEDELEVLIRTCDELERVKALAPSLYPPEDQARDLDCRIAAIRQARTALNAELSRVQNRYNGPY